MLDVAPPPAVAPPEWVVVEALTGSFPPVDDLPPVLDEPPTLAPASELITFCVVVLDEQAATIKTSHGVAPNVCVVIA
jgi:hypothetical protein